MIEIAIHYFLIVCTAKVEERFAMFLNSYELMNNLIMQLIIIVL